MSLIVTLRGEVVSFKQTFFWQTAIGGLYSPRPCGLRQSIAAMGRYKTDLDLVLSADSRPNPVNRRLGIPHYPRHIDRRQFPEPLHDPAIDDYGIDVREVSGLHDHMHGFGKGGHVKSIRTHQYNISAFSGRQRARNR